jgi:DNA-binding transcriptional LysR family regulator
MSPFEELAYLGDVRPADVLLFVDIYERSKRLDASKLRTYAGLFGSDEKDGPSHSTVVGQLERIAAFAAHYAPPAAGPRRRRSGLKLLFNKDADPDGDVLGPTRIADQLYREFRLLKDLYRDIESRLGPGRGSTPAVRIGAGQNFGLHLLPYIFTNWNSLFGDNIRLTVEIKNTADLLPRLNAGLLDCVLAYGSEDDTGIVQEELPGTAFTSFGYWSRMVLVCHPLAPLWLSGGTDANADYWRELWPKGTGSSRRPGTDGTVPPGPDSGGVPEREPRYDSLRPLDLQDIDYERTELFIGRSWDQPEGVRNLLKPGPAGKGVRLVNAYDEGMALVRMAQGVALGPEVFCKRPLVCPFRLEPVKDYRRLIGAYYSTRYPLAAEAFWVMTFARKYLDRFKGEIRNGKPPAFNEPKFQKWCGQFRMEGDWKELAAREYPMKKGP